MIPVTVAGQQEAEQRRVAALKSTHPGGEYASQGIHEGPHDGAQPQEMDPEDFTRGYVSEGHAADSPQNEHAPHAQHVPHVDLRASRGVVRAMSPHHFPPCPPLPGDRP